MTFCLYDYQQEAIDDLFRRFASGSMRVPTVAATGLGKTEIFVASVARWLVGNPGKRVLVIAHTTELIDQAAKKFRQRVPAHRVGIVKGTLNQATAPIIVSSRQTLASAKRRRQIRNVGLIIIDECHHAVATNTYGRILQHFGALDACEHSDDPTSIDTKACSPCVSSGRHRPAFTPVAGFTATLVRGDRAKLSSIWEECTFSRDILFGIKNGYLLDVKGERVVVADMNLKNVRMNAGDFSESALAEELERSFAIETVADEYVRLASDRKGIAFWPLVATAEHAAEVFNGRGIPSAAVSGQTDKRERERILSDLRSGAIQVVHNAMVLTEGFDDPSIEAIVIGRPTKSPILYPQMAGRGLRKRHDIPISEQRACLLIDVTGAGETSDLRGLIDLSPERNLQGAYDEHPDATLSELEEFFEMQIEEELDQQRAGASYEFESEQYSGPTTTKSFDPLSREKAWGKTNGGTYYVRGGRLAKDDAFVFITPALSGETDRYDIVACSVNTGFDPEVDAAPEWATGFPDRTNLPLEQALLHGDMLAGDSYNKKNNGWYNRAPSRTLKIKAWRLGVHVGQMTHGELREAIDVHLANARIDPLVADVRARVQQSNA